MALKKQSLADYDLKQFYLFGGLSEAQRALLKQSMLQYHLDAGEFLFEHGRAAERFFIQLEGHIKLIRLSSEGIEKVIEIINPGESFAEAIMFMPRQVYPVSAQAVVASTVLSFESKVFMHILEDSFDTCKRVMHDMGMRLRIWLNEIDNLTLQNATYRLVHYLLSHAPTDCNSDCLVEFKIPKQVVASRLSVKPETLSRIIHQLADKGFIEPQGQGIKICNLEKLRQYVYSDLE